MQSFHSKARVQRTLVLSTLALVLSSCTEGPKQYTPEELKVPKVPLLEKAKGIIDLGKEKARGSDTELNDARAARTTRQPIIYKQGIGGITFDTTFEESLGLLEKPRRGPDPGTGVTIYSSWLIAFWRESVPRVPNLLRAERNYLGEMQAGPPIGNFTLNRDFSTYGTSKSGAQKLARDLYLSLEKPQQVDEKNPCGEGDKFCRLEWEDNENKDFLIHLPYATFRFAKESFRLAMVLLFPYKPYGKLRSPYDFTRGTFQTPGDNGSLVPIGLGASADEIKKVASTPTEELVLPVPTVGANYFEYSYADLKVQFSRIDSKNRKDPSAEDVLSEVLVLTNFAQPLMMNGRTIYHRTVKGPERGASGRLNEKVELKLVETNSDEAEATEWQPFTTSSRFPGRQIEAVASELRKLVEESLKQECHQPNCVYRTYIMGGKQQTSARTYEVQGVIYDSQKAEGRLAFLAISESDGGITGAGTRLLGGKVNPFDPVLIPKILQGINPNAKGKFFSMGGLSLGDKIELTDIDLGRNEATVKWNGITGRTSFTPSALAEVAYDEDNLLLKAYSVVSLGSLPISVGLDAVTGSFTETTLDSSIQFLSSVIYGPVNGICRSVSAEPTESEGQFISKFQNLPSCLYKVKDDGSGMGTISDVFFPRQALSLGFAQGGIEYNSDWILNRELGTASIYMSPVGEQIESVQQQGGN